MRVCQYCCSLVALVLLFLICIWQADRGDRALSRSSVDEAPVQLGRPTRKRPQEDLGKDVGQDGGPRGLGRKLLLMKTGARKEVSFLEDTIIGINSNDVGRKRKGSSRRRSRKMRRRLKHVDKKGHQRDDVDGVGASALFTEDYRVPRLHPPRNN